MTKKEYNGWFNYETWVINLWMDNERGEHDYWLDQAKHFARKANLDQAKIDLADQIKEEHEAGLPDLKGFAADLLNAAMSEVNWYEIAEHIINEVSE